MEERMKLVRLPAILCVLLFAGCNESAESEYGSPEDSGLIAVRPFPAEGDVCQVIGENALTSEYLGDSSTLIGCPKVDSGAISVRIADGATTVGEVGEWVLLSVPN
jgi:hypothetical protein